MDTKPFRTTRRIANLKQGRNQWYAITNSAGPGLPVQVSIYDEIGYFGVTASDFIRDLADVKGPVELHLNTPGGEVFDGIAIYSALQQRGDVSVIVDSLAASIGSVIAMAASPGKLQMSPGSQMMIHDGFGMGIGNAADMRQLADLLDRQSDNIASIYADRTGQPAGTWRAAMRAETWYAAAEAVTVGLADGVLGKPAAAPAVAAEWDLSVFSPATGGGLPAVLDAVDTSPWDASKAWHNGSTSDDPAAFYAGICAGKKAGDKSMQSAWALPYKYHPGDGPNAAGVRAALGRIDSTDGLTNKAEAQELLERLMKQCNPDYEPSNTTDLSWIDQLDLSAFKEATK